MAAGDTNTAWQRFQEDYPDLEKVEAGGGGDCLYLSFAHLLPEVRQAAAREGISKAKYLRKLVAQQFKYPHLCTKQQIMQWHDFNRHLSLRWPIMDTEWNRQTIGYRTDREAEYEIFQSRRSRDDRLRSVQNQVAYITSSTTEWATNVSIDILSRVLQVKVLVWSSSGDVTGFPSRYEGCMSSSQTDHTRWPYLLIWNVAHFHFQAYPQKDQPS